MWVAPPPRSSRRSWHLARPGDTEQDLVAVAALEASTSRRWPGAGPPRNRRTTDLEAGHAVDGSGRRAGRNRASPSGGGGSTATVGPGSPRASPIRPRPGPPRTEDRHRPPSSPPPCPRPPGGPGGFGLAVDPARASSGHAACRDQPFKDQLGRRVDHHHRGEDFQRLAVHRPEQGNTSTTMSSESANKSLAAVISIPMAGLVMTLRSAAPRCPKTRRREDGVVDATVAIKDPSAEAVDKGSKARPRGHRLAGGDVGIDRPGPVSDQQIGHGGLARPMPPVSRLPARRRSPQRRRGPPCPARAPACESIPLSYEPADP